MQLRRATSYAICVLIQLAQNGQKTMLELAEDFRVDESYAKNVLKALKEHGYVKSVHGKHGGFRLDKKPKDLLIWDILNALEPTMKINRCLEEDNYCSRDNQLQCDLREIYSSVQEKMERTFSSLTIADIIEIQRT